MAFFNWMRFLFISLAHHQQREQYYSLYHQEEEVSDFFCESVNKEKIK